jgi:CHASE2 domain-containing sensor protein
MTPSAHCGAHRGACSIRLVGLTYAYLIAWMAGGVALWTMLLLSTRRRPIALAFALVGFGGAGFLAQGIGVEPWQTVLSSALGAAVIAGALGYVVERLERGDKAPL